MLRLPVILVAFLCVPGLSSAQHTAAPAAGASPGPAPDTAGGARGTRVVNFSGGVVDRSVTLNWETVSETGIREFIVEHAAQGGTFESVGRVPAKGSGKYSFRYKSAPGQEQARLRIIKTSGDTRFSTPLGLNVNGPAGALLDASPNPASGSVQIQGLSYGDQAVLLGANGQAVRSFTATRTSEPLNLEGLPGGVYLLQVRSAEGEARPALRIVKR